MGDYGKAAEFYDLLYAGEKDYERESDLVARLVRARNPGAKTLLDVGCGTGAHARGLVDLGFEVSGIDLEPAFVEIASSKCPEASFAVADMRSFERSARYDAVVCLFSAIGYALTLEGLAATLVCMANHLTEAGVVVVDPWFQPEEMSDGYVTTIAASGDGTEVVRMSRTLLRGRVSTLEFEYLIGTPDGIEHRSEIHQLGLFTEAEMVRAFESAGLEVERIEKALRTRGIYVGTRRPFASFSE